MGAQRPLSIAETYTLPFWGTTPSGRKVHRVNQNEKPRGRPQSICGQELDYVWVTRKLTPSARRRLCRKCA